MIFLSISKAVKYSMSIFIPNIVLPLALSFLWVMFNLLNVIYAFRESVAKSRIARNTENIENIKNVSEMTDDNIHDLLIEISKRFVIPTWYDRSHLSSILNRAITDTDWGAIIRHQREMVKSINDVTRQWGENMLKPQ